VFRNLTYQVVLFQNWPSFVVRNLTHRVVLLAMAMISGRKSNHLSFVARHLAMIFGRKSNHASYVAQNLATIFRHMSGKFVNASHTRLPVKASVNSFLCLEYEKELTLCGCSANCNAEEGQERKIIEKSNCLSVIARDFTHCKRIRSVTRENQRKTRDRQPSRIPVRRVQFPISFMELLIYTFRFVCQE